MILPLALSASGWTAIGAVGGALVGASAGAMADGYFAHRKEKRLAKAGARLLAKEIANADHRLRDAQETTKWWAFYDAPMSSWEEYQDTFATVLSNEQFEAVSRSAMDIRELFAKMPGAAPWNEGEGYRDLKVKAEDFDPVRADAARAYDALAKLGGHSRVGERITPADSPPEDS